MRVLTGSRYWIVGASEGLGRAVAERLSREGVELVLSARSADRLHGLAAELPGRSEVVEIDVTDTASIAAAREAAGRIDGLVFLAGVYWPMKTRDWDTGRIAAMFDVNLTGAARVVGAVLPKFLEADRGHIVLIGSLSGFSGLPGAVGYGASKAGVMSLAETMRCDLRGTGVTVQQVNPGFVRTRLTDRNDFRMPFIMDPAPAAEIIVTHMRTDRFARSFPRGFSFLFRLGRLLPESLYFRLFA